MIRLAHPADLDAILPMRHALWPEGSLDEHRSELQAILAGKSPGDYPYSVLIATGPGKGIIGFVEAALRSYADGCDRARPVGYLEGWYVDPSSRNKGVGRALVLAAEDWAREQGCREMASDTWIDNEPSQRAHLSLGYEVVDRCVNFRKNL